MSLSERPRVKFDERRESGTDRAGDPFAYEMIEPKGGEGMPMLRSLKDFEGYAVSATDGDIGHVANFLLDDERWIVRYLVVETGGFFSGRRVLISPISFRQVDWSTRASTWL